MTARVLLTGITGYIGQHCAAELLNRAIRWLGQFAPALRLALRELALETFLPADALPAAAMQPLVTVSLNPYAP